MKFCNQCGNGIKDNAKFCRNCGQQFDKTVIKPINQQATRTPAKRKRQAFKNRPLKQKILISVLTIIGLMLVISYFTLSYLWSADRLTKQLQTAIVEGDYLKVAEIVEFEDEAQKIGEENAQVLLRTINEYDLLEELLTHFNLQADKRTTSTHDILNLRQTSRFLGFNQYEITAKPYYLFVSSNLNNTQIQHNGQPSTTIEVNDDVIEIGPLVYGEHNFSATYENDYVNLEINEYSYISHYSNELNFYFDVSTIWIPDDFISSDTEILLNDKLIDQTMIIDDIYNSSSIGPIDPELDYTIELNTTFPWGELSTGKVDVDIYAHDNYFNYQLNDALIDDLTEGMTSFYDKLSLAYEKNDLSQLNILSDGLYDDYEYEIGGIHNYVKDEELIYFRDLKSFGIYNDFLQVYYDDETERSNVIISVFEEIAEEYEWYSGYLNEPYYEPVYYLYHLTYQDDQWNVVYRKGDYRSSIEEATYQSIDYSGDPIQLGTINEKADSNQDENDLITNATVKYIDNMVEAINADDYSLVEPYIKNGSLLEDMQIGLVERLVEAGTTQEVIYREVIDIEQDGDQWFAYTDETIKIIFESGDQESRDYNWKYTVVKDGNDFKLTNIERE